MEINTQLTLPKNMEKSNKSKVKNVFRKACALLMAASIFTTPASAKGNDGCLNRGRVYMVYNNMNRGSDTNSELNEYLNSVMSKMEEKSKFNKEVEELLTINATDSIERIIELAKKMYHINLIIDKFVEVNEYSVYMKYRPQLVEALEKYSLELDKLAKEIYANCSIEGSIFSVTFVVDNKQYNYLFGKNEIPSKIYMTLLHNGLEGEVLEKMLEAVEQKLKSGCNKSN